MLTKQIAEDRKQQLQNSSTKNVSQTDTHSISKPGLGQVTAENLQILIKSWKENVSETDTHKISKTGLGQVTAQNLAVRPRTSAASCGSVVACRSVS